MARKTSRKIHRVDKWESINFNKEMKNIFKNWHKKDYKKWE